MKFKTFRATVLATGTCLVMGLGFLLFSRGSNSSTPTSMTVAATPMATATAPTVPISPSSVPTLATAASSSRLVEQQVFPLLQRPATTDKIKDALPNARFKVSLYRDNGFTSWNRVKIDLDRDDLWDEKWDIVNQVPTNRQVASQDNEQYDQRYLWQGGSWVVSP